MSAARLIIDCDPGLDDAVAIALALASPQLGLAALVTVAGNAGIDRVTRNALAILQALGASIPVYRGHGRSLAGHIRLGISRWGGTGDLGLPESLQDAAAVSSDDYMGLIEAGSATIAAIGPLTNIAALLAAHPRARNHIERLVIMGGNFEAGNPDPAAEFNIWADPFAARSIFESALPATIVPLDVTRSLVVAPAMGHRLLRGSGPSANLFRSLLALIGQPGHPAALHDACAIGWLLWPDLFTGERGTVMVATGSGARQGETRLLPDPSGPHLVLRQINRDMVLERLLDRLAGGG